MGGLFNFKATDPGTVLHRPLSGENLLQVQIEQLIESELLQISRRGTP